MDNPYTTKGNTKQQKALQSQIDQLNKLNDRLKDENNQLIDAEQDLLDKLEDYEVQYYDLLDEYTNFQKDIQLIEKCKNTEIESLREENKKLKARISQNQVRETEVDQMYDICQQKLEKQ